MSHLSEIGRFSAWSFDVAFPFGASATFTPLLKPVTCELWPTGSLDVNSTCWPLNMAVVRGENSQFLLSIWTTACLATIAFSASGFLPFGELIQARPLVTPLVLGST